MATHFLFLADGGASKTQSALLSADANTLARARTGACNLFQDPVGGLANVWAGWLDCCASAGLDPGATAPVTIISAGLAGVTAPGAPKRFAEHFSTCGGRHLSSDGYATLVCAVPEGAGALLSIGTGTVGCRFDDAGHFTSLGGWGFPIGDQGGGAWLGFTLVQRFLQHLDGVVRQDDSQPLWDALQRVVGTDRAGLLGWLRAAPPSRFGELAPLVLASGTPAAHSLRAEAVGHLAALARALLGAEKSSLFLAGGLAGSFADALAETLAPTSVTCLDPAVLDGLLHIARGVRPAEFAATGRAASAMGK